MFFLFPIKVSTVSRSELFLPKVSCAVPPLLGNLGTSEPWNLRSGGIKASRRFDFTVGGTEDPENREKRSITLSVSTPVSIARSSDGKKTVHAFMFLIFDRKTERFYLLIRISGAFKKNPSN
jgi:hypothetical protein